ncbi:MAG: ATP-binding cassette domain-containing protein [Anaerolineales bacterium]
MSEDGKPSARIACQSVMKFYGPKRAVNGVTLQVGEGEIYALTGPDGAGKTTLVQLLAGTIKPDSGEVWLCGHSMRENPGEAHARLGYLSQGFSLYEDLTVAENLRFFAEVRGIKGGALDERVHRTLDFVGLEPFAGRLAGALSGGMKQKLALGGAMIHEPGVLLLDEPTSGVDPITRQAFWRLLVALLERGTSVLMTTPYMDEAARCHRVGLLREGRLMIEGTPAALTRDLSGRMLEVRGDPLRVIADRSQQLEEVERVQLFGDHLHLSLRPDSLARVQDQLLEEASSRNWSGVSVEAVEPSLEDAFLALLERQA